MVLDLVLLLIHRLMHFEKLKIMLQRQWFFFFIKFLVVVEINPMLNQSAKDKCKRPLTVLAKL